MNENENRITGPGYYPRRPSGTNSARVLSLTARPWLLEFYADTTRKHTWDSLEFEDRRKVYKLTIFTRRALGGWRLVSHAGIVLHELPRKRKNNYPTDKL